MKRLLSLTALASLVACAAPTEPELLGAELGVKECNKYGCDTAVLDTGDDSDHDEIEVWLGEVEIGGQTVYLELDGDPGTKGTTMTVQMKGEEEEEAMQARTTTTTGGGTVIVTYHGEAGNNAQLKGEYIDDDTFEGTLQLSGKKSKGDRTDGTDTKRKGDVTLIR